MKFTKYVAIALAIVAILASVSWFLRNSIIQRISAPILSEYGLTIVDVSLDALATENALISHLELQHQNGATIVIDDLTLPLGSSTTDNRTFAAEHVTVDIPSETGTEPLDLPTLIDQLLSLPEVLPNTEILVSELTVERYATVHDVRWTLADQEQRLTANLNAVRASAQIVATGNDSSEAKFSLKQTSVVAPEQSITTEIRHTDSGISLSGASIFDLPTIGMIATSVAASFGSTLAGVEFANGATVFELSAELPYGANQPASVTAYLKPSAPFDFAYSVKSGVINAVSVRSASPIKLESSYPETQWSISEEQASLLISYEGSNDIATSITDLNCANGAICLMKLNVAIDNADLTFATADRLELTATQDVEFGAAGIRMLIRPEAELALTAVSVSDTELARVNAVLMSTATLELTDSGWQFEAEGLEADIDSLSLDDDIKFSAPISLRNLSLGESNQPMSIAVEVSAKSSRINWGERAIAFPGFNGSVSLHNKTVTADVTTVGLHKDANIRAEHNLDAENGRILIQGAGLLFDGRRLSGRISPWTDDWDITAGTVSSDVQMNWQKTVSGWQLDGQSSLSAVDLAGAYSDSAFAGLSTSIEADFETTTGIFVEPTQISIDLVEVGLPIEDITADYLLNPNTLSVDVENLRMHAFGGIVSADPFTYELENESNSLLLRAESMKLTELLTLKEFEAIELSGSIGAELPVTIVGGEISINNGTLTGEAPGGVIRYQPDIIPEDTGASGIGLVTRALSNFEYETLTSTVDYSKDGDLVLQMQLAGRNPDLEDNRPVVLNLGVENNIPQMLRSLQAARAVEEILEKRIQE